jgi:hypothetical protein
MSVMDGITAAEEVNERGQAAIKRVARGPKNHADFFKLSVWFFNPCGIKFLSIKISFVMKQAYFTTNAFAAAAASSKPTTSFKLTVP